MRLKHLVILACLLYVAVIGTSIVLQRIYVVFPELETATKQVHQSNIQSIYATFVAERESLISANLDWSKWTDTYDYVNGNNPSYIKENIDTNSFSQMDIDAAIILDLQGKVLYAGEKNYVKNTFTELSNTHELTDHLHIPSLINQAESYGMIQHGGRLAYYVSNYIQDSLEEKDSNGVLVFIRDLKADFTTRISLQLNLEIDITLSQPNTQSNFNQLKRIEEYELNSAKSQYLVGLANVNNEIIGAFSINYPEYKIPKLFDRKTIMGIFIVILLPLAITILVYLLFLKPINHIYFQIFEMRNKNQPQRITKNSFIYEINTFINTFNELVEKIKHNEKALMTENFTDGLTQIKNRKYFDKAYDESWRECTRSNHSICVVMVDIDNFKKYNDRYGHQQGDATLIKVAKALNNLTRRAGDLAARYGGEEFTLILHAKTEIELSQLLKHVINTIINLNIEHLDSNHNHLLTISCGACFIGKGGVWMKDKKEHALKLADEALYLAKEQGRNQFQIKKFTENDA